MPFSEYLPSIAPPPLAGIVGTSYWTQVGAVMDDVKTGLIQAAEARFPDKAASDGLDQLGLDRLLPRVPGASDAAQLARVKAAWTEWGGDNTPLTGVGGGAGTPLAMLNELALLGLPTGTSGMTIVYQNGRYAQLVAGALTFGTLMACINRHDLTGSVPGTLAGWTFEGRDTFYSEFGIVFPANVVALTDGSDLAGQLQEVVHKWKPGKAVYVGTWIIQTGRTLGWPTGRTLGGDPNLGSNVIRYIAPAGGNRIGYTP